MMPEFFERTINARNKDKKSSRNPGGGAVLALFEYLDGDESSQLLFCRLR